MSQLYRLNVSDFAKGAFSAVVAGFVFAVAGLMQTPDFNVFTADWGMILSFGINAAVAAFVGYIGKNFLSDSEGRPLGIGK